MPLRSLKAPVLDDLLALLQTFRDGDEIAARFAEPDKLLAQDQFVFLRLFVFLFLDHVNRIAERRVGDGGRGNEKGGVFLREQHLDSREHPCAQSVVLILERRLDLHAARRGID